MNHNKRIELARKSLKGLSIGDSFGESFFGETNVILDCIKKRQIPETKWEYTDDTVMGIAVLDQLEKNKTIIQDELAIAFSKNHELDVNRRYGATARRILREIDEGRDWRIVSKEVFEGMGSMGNGASMRVSPIGAYYYDDKAKVKELAIKSAEITHSNIEGIAGAIAVALGTAIATRVKLEEKSIEPKEFIEELIYELPDTDTKSKIKKSISLPYSYNIETVKSVLGNGSKIMVQDTVPYSIWCSAYNLNNFEESLWKAVSILGDRDTICAIVGGITMMSTRDDKIPIDWLNLVEKYETSDFRNKKIKT